jgi:hypothetical protein
MHTRLRKYSNPRLRYFFPPDPPLEGGGGTGGGGGSGAPAGESGAGGAGGSGAAGDDRGYPQGTPVAEMTDAQQAAYWKFHSRKHEDQVRALGDTAELRRKAEAWDKHEAENATEIERARREGEEAGKAAVTATHRAELAEFALRGALSGLEDGKRDAVLAAVDFAKFVGDNGRPDETKIKAFVATVASPPSSAGDTGGGHGGHRPPGKGSSLASGAERYAERHGKKDAATS